MNFKKVMTRLGVTGILLFLGFALPVSSLAQNGEVAITTTSNDALESFLDGRQQFENFKLPKSRMLFDQAIKEDPGFALAHLYRALSSNTEKNYKKHLEQAYKLKDNVSQGEQLLIQSAYLNSENRPIESIATLEKLNKMYPQDKRVHQYLGIILLNQEKEDRAVKEFTTAIEIDPDYAPAYNLLGYAYKNMEMYPKAENAFSNYVRLLPDEANPHDSIADLYTKMGRHDDAIYHYKMAIEKDPNFHFSQLKIGTNLIFKGNHEEGRAAIRQAVEMTQNPADRIYNMVTLADTYLYEGLYDKSLSEVDKALKLADEENLSDMTAWIFSRKCSVYLDQNDIENAKKSIEKCQQIVDKSNFSKITKSNYERGILFNKALIDAKNKDYESAFSKAEQYRKQVAADNNQKEMKNFYALLGYINDEKGNYAEAVKNLKMADQKNPYVLYKLAETEWTHGNKEEAKILFKKVANWNEHSLDYALVRSRSMNHE